MAGVVVFLLVDVNSSFGHPVSHAGQQAHAMGFHSRYGHPFTWSLLLERRPDRAAME
jgi:hypothetical protein